MAPKENEMGQYNTIHKAGSRKAMRKRGLTILVDGRVAVHLVVLAPVQS